VSELPAGGGLEKVGPAEGSCTRVIKIRQLKFKIIEFLRSLVAYLVDHECLPFPERELMHSRFDQTGAQHSLSPIMPGWGGDEDSMPQRSTSEWSKLLILENLTKPESWSST
jgi:hypothetical protein